MRLASLLTTLCLLAGADAATAATRTKKPAATAQKKPASSKKRVTKRRRPARIRPTVRITPALRREANAAIVEALDRNSGAAVENAAALVPFYEQLFRQQRNQKIDQVHVLHWGDSHTASDDWTGAVRYLLQNQFGDAGSGFAMAGHPFAGYRRLDLRHGGSRGWSTEGLLTRFNDSLHGLGGVSLSTDRAGEYVMLEAECRHIEVFFLRQPGGGSLTLTDNGVAVGDISTDGELGPGSAAFDLPMGSHHLELRTQESKSVRLYGWVTEKDRGITYESMGINGAQASLMARWDEAMFAEYVAKRNPALIVLAYGTNEASNREWSQESYRQMFDQLLKRLRAAAPAASILVLGPPDRWLRVRGKWSPYARIGVISDAQRDAALDNGCAFWDIRDKMGGTGSMRQWVLAGLGQYDHVHFTTAGYRRLGYVLFRDLMYNYERYVKVRGELTGSESSAALARRNSSFSALDGHANDHR